MIAGGHLLSCADLDRTAIERILDTAEELGGLADRPVKKLPVLRGRTVCNLFHEDSTRTRLSFELAAKRLSADVLTFTSSGSSVAKGESLKDTALTLQAMGVDAIVLRHPGSGAAHQLAGWVDARVLNAGDGCHQHPTQALVDLFTVRRRVGRLDGLTVTVVGDVAHSRVARSLTGALAAVGARVRLCGPPTLLPDHPASWAQPGADVTAGTDLDAWLADTDVLYLLRVQRERMDGLDLPAPTAYARGWAVGVQRAAALPDHAVVAHPGPMNRGVEISGDLADDARTVALDQVANGIAVRMSCLYLLLGGEEGRR